MIHINNLPKQSKVYKRVLVLAGGGAKGAYAFGCIQAFHENNIKFDAISGTSVGALNSVLLATDSIEYGRDIWRNLSFETIYPLKFTYMEKFPKVIIWLVSIIYVLLRIILATFNRTPVELGPLFRFVLITILTFPVFNLFYNSKQNWDAFLWIIFPLGYAYFGWHVFNKRSEGGKFIFLPLAIMCWCFYISINLGLINDDKTLYNTIMSIIFIAALPLVLMLGSLKVYDWLKNKEFEDWTILSSSKLADKIKYILNNNSIQIPTYVTAARIQDIFDPDDPKWLSDSPGRSPASIKSSTFYPDVNRDWAVEYISLDDLEKDLAVKYCLASAALPFGIVPFVKINGEEYVDGGVIDNIPWFPFIERFKCEEMYIVLLDSFNSDAEALRQCKISKEEWSYKQRKKEISKYKIPGNKSYDDPMMQILKGKNNPPKIIPFKTPPKFPKIHLFYPNKVGLGGLIRGTLNFNKKYASTLINIGREQTLRKLEKMKPL